MSTLQDKSNADELTKCKKPFPRRPPRPPPPTPRPSCHTVCVSSAYSSVIVNFKNVAYKDKNLSSCQHEVTLRDIYDCPSTASAIFYRIVANNGNKKDESEPYEEQSVSLWVVEEDDTLGRLT
jgi:hypothetical protein